MDWLLQHFGVIIVVVAIIASALKQMKPSKSSTPPAVGGPKPVSDDRAGDNDDGGYDERTRRIQEEIRRKIAERRGQSASPPPVPAAAPRPTVSAWTEKEETEEPFVFQPEAPRPVVAQAPVIDPVFERQRLLAEQLAVLEQRRAAINVSAQSQAAWTTAAPATVGAADASEAGWLRELRNARSVRKAVVLREVIGPPVALR